MINFSFSTVLMATLFCNFIIIGVCFIFRSKKILPDIGLRLTGFILLITIIRPLFPIEIPMISHNIIFPEKLSKIMALFQKPRFWNSNLSWWSIFEIIWLLVAVILAINFIYTSFHAYSFLQKRSSVTDCDNIYNRTLRHILNDLNQSGKISLRISSSLHIPVVYGLKKPCIIFPDSLKLSERELYYALRHEVQHVLHHDLWLKLGVHALSIIYWWNPFCWFLKRYVDLFLEMRVDHAIASTPEEKAIYLSCLTKIAKQNYLISMKISAVSIPFCQTRNSILIQRFNFVINGSQDRLNILLQRLIQALVILIFIFSFLFIFEAHYMSPDNYIENEVDYNKTNSFFVNRPDGDYDFYINAQYIETVDSLKYYSHDIPVYDSLEEALQQQAY